MWHVDQVGEKYSYIQGNNLLIMFIGEKGQDNNIIQYLQEKS